MTPRTLVAALLATLLLATASPRSARADFWEPTNGPEGGIVKSMLVLSPDTVLAGTYFGGVYRTVNGGASWTAASNGLTNLHVFALATAPGGAIFAGTPGGGVFRSVDRGLTWAPASNGLWNLSVYALAALSPDTLLAGTYQSGVFRSVDAGASWSWTSSGLNSSAALDIHAIAAHPDGRVYIGTYDHVYRSSDRGESWTLAATGLANTYCWALRIRADGLIAVGTPNGCYLSGNGGDTWASSGLSTNISILDVDARANGELFAASGNGIYTSVDNGASWTWHTAGLSTTDVECVRVAAGTRVYAGTYSGGAFRSDDDGASWVPFNSGLRQSQVSALLAQPSGTLYAGTDGGGVFKSLDHGDTWTLTALTNRHVTAFAQTGSTVLAAFVGDVWRTSDGGTSWTVAGLSLPDPNAWSLAVRPTGDIFVGTSSGVSRLAALGGTWQALAGFPAFTGVGSLLALPNGTVIAGTLNSGPLRSIDAGVTWTPITTGLPAGSRFQAMAADTGGRIFAGTMNGGIYRSLDQGDHWEQVAAPGGYVDALTVNSVGSIYAALRFSGVVRSQDHGVTWLPLATGLGAAEVLSLATDNRDVVFAGTQHDGAFRTLRSTTDVAAVAPAAMRGLNASPNPFRRSLALRFTLAHAGRASLVVYDVAGRPLRTLASGVMAAGSHVAAWDGADERGHLAPAGVYFGRLVFESGEHVTRVVRIE